MSKRVNGHSVPATLRAGFQLMLKGLEEEKKPASVLWRELLDEKGFDYVLNLAAKTCFDMGAPDADEGGEAERVRPAVRVPARENVFPIATGD